MDTDYAFREAALAQLGKQSPDVVRYGLAPSRRGVGYPRPHVGALYAHVGVCRHAASVSTAHSRPVLVDPHLVGMFFEREVGVCVAGYGQYAKSVWNQAH